jgi:hypothetical protein
VSWSSDGKTCRFVNESLVEQSRVACLAMSTHVLVLAAGTMKWDRPTSGWRGGGDIDGVFAFSTAPNGLRFSIYLDGKLDQMLTLHLRPRQPTMHRRRVCTVRAWRPGKQCPVNYAPLAAPPLQPGQSRHGGTLPHGRQRHLGAVRPTQPRPCRHHP